MVAQFTPQQQLAPPPVASPSLSPAQWAQVNQILSNPQQYQTSPQQAAQPSTSAYTSSGTMSAIDPALLYQQWLQYQSGQLAHQAVIPQYQQHLPQQLAPQYPQQEVNELTFDRAVAITQFINDTKSASAAAENYINFLERAVGEYFKLADHSKKQDELINNFLYDRDFTLEYVRGAWIQHPIDDRFMSALADVYLEIDALSPRHQRQQEQRKDPMYTGSQQLQFTAQVVPQQIVNTIPPLPNNSGNSNGGITMEQMAIAAQNGQLAQARAAALRDPSGLYAALFQ